MASDVADVLSQIQLNQRHGCPQRQLSTLVGSSHVAIAVVTGSGVCKLRQHSHGFASSKASSQGNTQEQPRLQYTLPFVTGTQVIRDAEDEPSEQVKLRPWLLYRLADPKMEPKEQVLDCLFVIRNRY